MCISLLFCTSVLFVSVPLSEIRELAYPMVFVVVIVYQQIKGML